jgi:hypothetical protein
MVNNQTKQFCGTLAKNEDVVDTTRINSNRSDEVARIRE